MNRARPQAEIASAASTASISKTVYTKPPIDKTVNGFVVNTATLG